MYPGRRGVNTYQLRAKNKGNATRSSSSSFPIGEKEEVSHDSKSSLYSVLPGCRGDGVSCRRGVGGRCAAVDYCAAARSRPAHEAPGKKDVPALVAFIGGPLAEEGVNTLILEFNYGFDFKSRPEFADAARLGKDEAASIAKACREKGIELIPQINCLGHQSWAKHTDRFLQKHPEFDETPGKYPNNEGIYCRSYCPLHPEVHEVLFDLIDELARACEAKSFHVGMDEVFILADPDCPRCKGKSPAELFALEVTTLHTHLASIGCRMWMWGDRFIDGKATGIGEWEASTNGTAAAIDQVPKDIVICDWHYEKAHPTPQFFAAKGFEVVACPCVQGRGSSRPSRARVPVRGDADDKLAEKGIDGQDHLVWRCPLHRGLQGAQGR